jgi:hypothetical protein
LFQFLWVTSSKILSISSSYSSLQVYRFSMYSYVILWIYLVSVVISLILYFYINIYILYKISDFIFLRYFYISDFLNFGLPFLLLIFLEVCRSCLFFQRIRVLVLLTYLVFLFSSSLISALIFIISFPFTTFWIVLLLFF